MTCVRHIAALLVDGIAYELEDDQVPAALIAGTMTRTDAAVQRPHSGARVTYGGIFSHCPRCGAKLHLEDLSSGRAPKA